ncbi:Sterile alpha motif domain [Macleaya cordata]|uniref:Sterile alpha motif domain n=1 Tax=Macleaya cordata TaxID=56857 RepID=A0A200PTU8_MACCD|nr:Sterile alpha motif domain [Macleaya cordata]
MYADRVSSGGKRSVKERLNGDSEEDFGRGRQNNNKRQRQNDNKWKHDLYEDDEDPQVSNPRVGVNDLRLKLQKKGLRQVYQRGKSSLAGGRQDLREKLSGTMHAQPANTDLPKAKPVTEVAKPARKSAPVEVPAPETKKVVSSAPSRKKTQQKGESVDGFLQSLGLEKYLITFQAEEVDMTALMHMTDEDLKALGMPMGPRKKILLALDSRA